MRPGSARASASMSGVISKPSGLMTRKPGSVMRRVSPPSSNRGREASRESFRALTMAPSAVAAAVSLGEPMTRLTRPALARITAILVVVLAAGACSNGPVSEAVESQGSSAAPASVVPSEAPPTAEPASEAPSEALATPAPTPKPTPVAIPPKPGKVAWTSLGSKTLAGGTVRESYRITWTSPEGVAETFKVYGVTTCLRDAKKYDGKPCVVKGMRIPKGTFKLIAQVPGSARSVDIAWQLSEIGPGPYYAVLIRATNSAGDSIFTIAWSAAVCWQCTY